MATDIENMQTARSNLLAALALHGAKRNYSIDGQQVSSGELWDRLEKLNAALAGIQGPIEVIDQAVT
jgi:hypothetical protein